MALYWCASEIHSVLLLELFTTGDCKDLNRVFWNMSLGVECSGILYFKAEVLFAEA